MMIKYPYMYDSLCSCKPQVYLFCNLIPIRENIFLEILTVGTLSILLLHYNILVIDCITNKQVKKVHIYIDNLVKMWKREHKNQVHKSKNDYINVLWAHDVALIQKNI